jgi:UDP-N-acetylmuramate--alanine ligase
MLPSGWADLTQVLAVNSAKAKLEKKSMKLPRDVGPIHFIGIGGIGMSGIAEVMATGNGYKVQGSTLSDNYNAARLRKNRH